jgi:hypothetical protein
MEEKKEKKTIKCSYAFLVIALCATVAFLTDYIVIDRKMNKCDCPKCEAKNNEVISDNTDNTQVTDNQTYSYEDIAGYYTTDFTFNSDKTDSTGASVFLHLYSDGTYSYRYSYHAPYGTIGNYIIKGNTIIMNDIAKTGSGADFIPLKSNEVSDVKNILIINKDGSLTDNNAPMSEVTGISSINLLKNSNDPIKEYNEFRMFVNYAIQEEY